MAGRLLATRAEPGSVLPVFDRIAPAPPTGIVADRLEALTAPGDVVVDLHGRGGWIARSAVDRQRRAITLEGSPLSRLLAEVVLRPPDTRHLDAAFQALSGSPRRDTSLKVWIGDRFATRCATCGRSLVVDEISWEPSPDGPARPVARHYRCTFCRDQRGGGEHRHGPLDDGDLERALDDLGEDGLVARRRIRERFPPIGEGDQLVDDLLDLHTVRQLAGLDAILERIEGDLRAAPVEAALRLAFVHAILPASRLLGQGGRVAALRFRDGHVRPPGGPWRERDPWLAFEDGFRLVRGFIQHLESGASGPLQARVGDDLLALIDGTAMASLRIGTASAYRGLAAEAREARLARGGSSRIGARLAIAQPPLRPTQERIALTYLLTAWDLGREAAGLLPLDALAGPGGRVPWGWQAAALGRSLTAVEPMLARDGRAILLCEPGTEEAVAAAVLGGVNAHYRVVSVRMAEPGDDAAIVELVPPRGTMPPPARTRANVALPALPGGAGDPELLPVAGLFAAPERFDARPFSAAEAARTVTAAAVEVLQGRGEPARTERLLGEVLVGLDRGGHLRRLVAGGAAPGDEPDDAERASGRGPAVAGPSPETGARSGAPTGLDRSSDAGRTSDGPARPVTGQRSTARPLAVDGPALWEPRPGDDELATGNVERLLALVRGELARPDQRRLVEIEPGRWWLADRADQEAAAVPLADRVEWAVFSLLSTAGPLSEAAFLERIAGLFQGYDLPDVELVRTCLESYRSAASTPDHLVTGDDLLHRTQEHTQLLAILAELGHRLGFAVWLNAREQERPVAGRRLGEWLDARERQTHLPLVVRVPSEDLADIDAIWYIRGQGTFYFEVEWTAMLSEPILRRHARLPTDDRTVRFLVVPGERTELVRHKLARSPLLRAAIEAGNWHLVKSHHLRTFAAAERPTLDGLAPYLGLDPVVERAGEQLPLFER